MANYIFSPSHNFGISEHEFVTWRNAFTDEEIDKLIEICEQFPKVDASINANGLTIDNKVRDTQIAWIPQTNDTIWIYDRLSWIARQLNGEFYKFDLFGFVEDFQYSTYNEETQGHYTWHRDSGVLSTGTPPRKLTMVLQLSDPADYEGGDLELFTKPEPSVVDKEQGMVVAFPSYNLHRVTPVTKGIRKTLVVWICGPAFK